jgi:ABC-type phosphate/phosphonate transport system substrate-binding protein
MTWKAALPMYNLSARLTRDYEALLTALAEDVGQAIVMDAPLDLTAFWRRPDLLLSQTCGYPYMTQLRGHVKLIATPCYDFAGCSGSDYSSVIIVRDEGDIKVLADAEGVTAAVNDPHSNSGMNVLRHVVAPLARDGRFFGEVVQSGSHAASVRMVRDGAADIAAIDCVTYGYLSREDPGVVAGLKVLGYCASSPGLPLIAGGEVSDEVVRRLRSALLRPSAALLERMRALDIVAFEYRTDADYARILVMETEAGRAGYPALS